VFVEQPKWDNLLFGGGQITSTWVGAMGVAEEASVAG